MHRQPTGRQKQTLLSAGFLFPPHLFAVNVFYKYSGAIVKNFRNFAEKFPLFSCIVQQMII